MRWKLSRPAPGEWSARIPRISSARFCCHATPRCHDESINHTRLPPLPFCHHRRRRCALNAIDVARCVALGLSLESRESYTSHKLRIRVLLTVVARVFALICAASRERTRAQFECVCARQLQQPTDDLSGCVCVGFCICLHTQSNAIANQLRTARLSRDSSWESRSTMKDTFYYARHHACNRFLIALRSSRGAHARLSTLDSIK